MKYALSLLSIVFCSHMAFAAVVEEDVWGDDEETRSAATARYRAEDSDGETERAIQLVRWKSITARGFEIPSRGPVCQIFMGHEGLGIKCEVDTSLCGSPDSRMPEIIKMDPVHFYTGDFSGKERAVLQWDSVEAGGKGAARRGTERRLHVTCHMPADEVTTFKDILFAGIASLSLVVDGPPDAYITQISLPNRGEGIHLKGAFRPTQKFGCWGGLTPETPFVVSGASSVSVSSGFEGKSSPTKGRKK